MIREVFALIGLGIALIDDIVESERNERLKKEKEKNEIRDIPERKDVEGNGSDSVKVESTGEPDNNTSG